MLSVRDLRVAFGGVRAVAGLRLDVAERTVHGLIGPNGAGKTTALHAMTGVIDPDHGSVQLDGRELVGLHATRMLRVGVARTFQQAQLWRGMSVEQNLTVPLLPEGRAAARARAGEVAEMLGFADRLHLPAGELPFGARRLVEVGRAVMTEPRLILLDEPGAGLTAGEKSELVDLLRELTQEGTATLLVDHDMDLVMRACDRVTVMDAGAMIASGTPEDVRADPTVQSVYLGRSA